MARKTNILELAPVAVAVVLGTCAILVLGPQNTDFSDSSDYLAAARMIVEHGTYPEVGGLPFFRAPLYPLFISLLWSVFPASIVAIKIAQVILHAATAWLIFKTAGRVATGRLVPVVAAMLFAVNPFIFYLSATIQTETLHIFLFTLALYLTVRILSDDRISVGNAVSLGITLGLAALCKPSALGIGVGLAVFLFAIRFRQRWRLVLSAAIVLAMFAAILPWSLYNLRTRGEFILINDAGGFNLWLGNLPQSRDLYVGSFATGTEAMAFTDYLGKTLARQQIDEWEQTAGYSSLSFKQREGLWTAKALENASAAPGTAVELFFLKFLTFWKPFLSSNIYSAKAVAFSALWTVPLYIFGLWGLVKTGRGPETRELVWLFAAIAVLATVVHVVVVSGMRLRLPYVDPFLTIFASVGIAELAARFFRTVRLPALDRFKVLQFAEYGRGESAALR